MDPPHKDWLRIFCSCVRRGPDVCYVGGRETHSASIRLDFIEINPKLRRGVFGLFAFSTVAARALEAGCSHLVLGALPEVRSFYIEAGGTIGALNGWKTLLGLLPFHFTQEALTKLKEQIDGLLIEG